MRVNQMAYGDLTTSLRSSEQAIAVFPAQISATINAGIALMRLGNFSQAVLYFNRALVMNNESAKAYGYMVSGIHDVIC